jgi:hypothetical protein
MLLHISRSNMVSLFFPNSRVYDRVCLDMHQFAVLKVDFSVLKVDFHLGGSTLLIEGAICILEGRSDC